MRLHQANITVPRSRSGASLPAAADGGTIAADRGGTMLQATVGQQRDNRRGRRRDAAADDGQRTLGDDAGTRRREARPERSEEHTSELQSRGHLVCRLLLEKKNTIL